MSKKADTWMPWFVGDYLADTTHLNTERHGAYCLMLMAAWKRGGSLPKDDAQLAEITKLGPAKWRASKAVLLDFFTEEDGCYKHKRVTKERERAQRISDAKARNGAKGAANRWHLPSDDMANAMANGSQTDAPSPSPSPGIGKPTLVAEDELKGAHTARADENGDFLGDKPPAGPSAVPMNAVLGSQITFAMRKQAGMSETNPSHPKLQALIAAGATVDEFVEAAKKAVKAGKGFGYALAIVEGQRKDAAAMAGQLHTGPLPAKPAAQGETFRERDQRLAAERMAEFAPNAARRIPPQPVEHPRNIIDVEPPYALAHRSN